MSPEEIERTMQFLLNQQAQFAVDIERLSVKTDRVTDGLIGLTSVVGHVTDAVGGLAAAQDRTDQQLRETSRKLEETSQKLEDADARLTEHLDIVIAMFERHLRKDHGAEPS